MDSTLRKLNASMKEAIVALEGPLKSARLATLQSTDSLPNKQIWSLASQAVDLADSLTRLLQPPSLQLAESYLSFIDTKCLVAVVEHGIPDLLEDGPITIEELANRSALQPLRLKQIMRVLHNNGIFAFDAVSETYTNNPSSQLLTSKHWTQWHRWVSLYGTTFYDFAPEIPAAIQAGETRSAAQLAFKTEENIYHYFAKKPGMQERFHAALGAGAVAQAPGLLADYPWHELEDTTVLDIGGGGGDFIVGLLRQNPRLQGALFELQSVIDMVRPKFYDATGSFADVGSRMTELHVGNFLESVPSYEVYTMKWCLHNWNDADVVKILRVVRKAIKKTKQARMVIIESALSEGRSSRVFRYGDLIMMESVNGQERTENDWRALAKEAGWEVGSITPMRNVWASAIDLRPRYVADSFSFML